MHVAVLGNSLGGLVLADACGALGHSVDIMAGPGPLLGPLRGVPFAGARWALGMVLLEFTSFRGPPSVDVQDYRPLVPGDSGRFTGWLRGWMEQLGLKVREVAPPDMVLEGRWLPDLLIANRLQALQGFPETLRNAVATELQQRVATPQTRLHASRKQEGFGGATLEEVSLANHGPTLHAALMEPWSLQCTGLPTAAFSAPHHRMAWLPLFHPETLASQFTSAPQRLADTRFHHPVGAGLEQLVALLELRVSGHAKVTVLPHWGTPGTAPHTVHCQGRCVAYDAVVYVGNGEGLEGRPLLDRAAVTVVLVEASVARADVSVVMLPGAAPGPYRVTQQSALRGMSTRNAVLSVEFNDARMAAAGPADQTTLVRTAVDTLLSLGLVARASDVVATSVLPQAASFTLPTPHNVRAAEAFQASLDARHPWMHRLGATTALTAVSLNDQVVGATRLACLLAQGAPP